jgi:hypothetical protein
VLDYLDNVRKTHNRGRLENPQGFIFHAAGVRPPGVMMSVRVPRIPVASSLTARCLIPGFDGAFFSREWKEALMRASTDADAALIKSAF